MLTLLYSRYFSSGFYHGWSFLACVSFFGRGFQDCPILFVSICFLFMLVWRSRKRGAALSFAPVYVSCRRHSLNPLSSPRLRNSTSLPQNLGVMAMSRVVLFAHDSFFGRGFQDCPIVFVSVCFPFLLVWKRGQCSLDPLSSPRLQNSTSLPHFKI